MTKKLTKKCKTIKVKRKVKISGKSKTIQVRRKVCNPEKSDKLQKIIKKQNNNVLVVLPSGHRRMSLSGNLTKNGNEYSLKADYERSALIFEDSDIDSININAGQYDAEIIFKRQKLR